LGISTEKRFPPLPDLPTIAEQGVPGYDIIQWFGVFGPAGLPKPIVDKLVTEINAIMKTPEFSEKVQSLGGTVYEGVSGEAFAAYIRTDSAKWDKLIKTANIKIE
jgi:tripartite-type tricarboxylate transporter receptor subunit TctC